MEQLFSDISRILITALVAAAGWQFTFVQKPTAEGSQEGEFMNTWDRFYYDEWGDVANHITFRTPRLAFASLINKISGKGTWERNPWVYAYEFELTT